jgi:hypothetical protein
MLPIKGKLQKRGIYGSHSNIQLTSIAFLLLVALVSCSTLTAPSSGTGIPTSPSASQPVPVTGPDIPCTSPATVTVSETEGPYFKAGSPEKSNLTTSNMTGTHLVLSGYVLTTDCKPVVKALLDFWQADASGQYDNSGYTLRGHQFTDSTGHYQLTSIIPGLYPGRTEHIHVKVQSTDGPVLTTQLFFPDVAQNQSDGIFDPSLLLRLQVGQDGDTASFNFIINQ